MYGLRCTFLVELGSVPTSLGERIHSPWFHLGLVVWQGYRPRVRLVLAGGHASAWISLLVWPCTGSPKVPSGFPQLVPTAATSGGRDVNVHGFSAGSYTGLAVHEILSAFAVFSGLTKVAAIATPPEIMRLATGERTVTLVHCLEDRLCVWKPDSLTEFSY